jgi:hypothetical protein
MPGDIDVPVNPLSLYDVAMVTDRVLKIKRALEASGLVCEVEAKIEVNLALTIDDPTAKKGKHGRKTRKG